MFYAKSKFYANRCIAGLIATLSGQYYGFALGITSKLISPPSVLPLLKAGSVLYVINNAQVSVAILAFRFKGTLWFGVRLYNQLLNRNKKRGTFLSRKSLLINTFIKMHVPAPSRKKQTAQTVQDIKLGHDWQKGGFSVDATSLSRHFIKKPPRHSREKAEKITL